MKVHANAALGPAGRIALCELIDQGMTLRAAAAALNVAPATAHRWWHRRRSASGTELACGAWLRDRSSCPHRQPRRLSAAEETMILKARRETNLGPGRLAGIVRRARSTIWKVLRRHRVSRLKAAPKAPARRYEWSRPGALLHVDTARLARFSASGAPGAGAHDRDQARAAPSARLPVLARRGRRPLALRLRRAAPRRDRRDRGRLPGQGDRPLRPSWSCAPGGGDERPRDGLSAFTSVRARARAPPRTPDPHAALHAALEREGGTLNRDAQTRVGLRPLMAELSRAHQGPAILPSLLQPAKAPQLAGRPAAHQPCSQRPWAGQLAG